MSQLKFVTTDGLYTVQAISLDGVAEYCVRRNGVWCYLPTDSSKTRDAHGRNPRTLEELALLVPLADLVIEESELKS